MKISYYPISIAETQFVPTIKNLALLPGVKRICEIGGGANPSLDYEFVSKHKLDYTVLDISQTELDKTPSCYKKIRADITDETLNLGTQFDLIFSRMVAEHVRNVDNFHKNVLYLLDAEGIVLHLFPTLFTLPFVLNKLIPESLSYVLLDYFAPRDKEMNSKFKAYYNWCFGPIEANIRHLEQFGYIIIEYDGIFGHGYYGKVKFLDKLENLKTQFLLQHPIPYLTSYAYLCLAKQENNLVSNMNFESLIKSEM